MEALEKAKEPRATTTPAPTMTPKRPSSTLTPPTGTPKRVCATASAAVAPQVAPVESLDVRPSTSKAAAAAALQTEPSSIAPTEPRASYATITKKVRVAVLPAEYPQVILSHGDLSALEESIMDEISVTGWGTAVAFTGIHFRVGHIVIDCADDDSADWLMTVAPRLSSWKGVPLDVRLGDNIPSPHTITIFCPRSADRATDNLLVMLSNQNKLETEAWRVVSRRNEGGGALLVIGIDEIAREDIVAKGH